MSLFLNTACPGTLCDGQHGSQVLLGGRDGAQMFSDTFGLEGWSLLCLNYMTRLLND